MNHTPFDLERHVEIVINRIAQDRAACDRAFLGTNSASAASKMRQRIGSVLIQIGERVGGPTVRSPKSPAPQPTHTPLFGF